MALKADIAAIKTAADLLIAGQKASWLVTDEMLKDEKVALDTWVSTATLEYSVTISQPLFKEEVALGINNEKDVTYYLITADFPAAA